MSSRVDVMTFTSISKAADQAHRIRNKFFRRGEERDFERLLGPTIDQTLAELRTLSADSLKEGDGTLQALASEYRVDVEKRPSSWEEVFQLELLAIKLLPGEMLMARLPIVEAKYKMAGLPALPAMKNPDDLKEASNRLLAMTVELQWNFRKSVLIQRSVAQLRNSLFWRFVIYLSVLLFISSWGYSNIFHLVILSMLMGLTGSFVSILRRIVRETPANGQNMISGVAYRDFTELEAGKNSVYYALLTGPIFGVVIMLILAGNILGSVGGDFVPEINAVLDQQPNAFQEAAKLMVWCFLAGFAEQLVPDVLDKLSGKAKSD